ATLSPGDIASPIRWILRRHRNVRVLMADVARVDVAGRKLDLADGGSLPYDYAIVAPGASHAYFGHDEWAPIAPGLKSLDDALEIRRRMLTAFEHAEREVDHDARDRLLTFVIVGGGPTGVELAGTLAEMARRTIREEFRNIVTSRTRIVLVDAGPSVLAAFPEPLQDVARKSLQQLGVEVVERTQVTAIDVGGVRLGDHYLPAATIVWAAGVAASPLVATMGMPLDRAGRVIVEPDLSIPGHPEVFVVGDAAAYLHQGERPLPGVAQVAMQGASHAAAMILRRIAGQPTAPFRYRNYGSMAIVGRGSAVADFGWMRLTGFAAWVGWLFLHIAQLIGFRNRASVFVQWAAAYFTRQRSVRLITGPRR
ncbi:MAG: NAD(P)/FAD-dependent oxidoreductase, partial [Vicinamibacterales bacterium]|nr:NAD(P)/FAD-dependent oxidoreductase [Vicinamibacterales bacterium]